MKKPLTVFMSEMKISHTLKESFLLYSFNAFKLQYFIFLNASAIRTETQLFPGPFASNSVLSASLLGMILVGNIVPN